MARRSSSWSRTSTPRSSREALQSSSCSQSTSTSTNGWPRTVSVCTRARARARESGREREEGRGREREANQGNSARDRGERHLATELTKRRGSAVMPTGSHFGVLCAPRVDRTRCVRFGFSHLSRPLARLRSRSRSLMFAHHARHSTRLLPPCEHALRDHRGLLHAAGLSDHVGRRRVHLNAAEPCWLRHEPQADARILENHRPRPSCAPTPPSLSP